MRNNELSELIEPTLLFLIALITILLIIRKTDQVFLHSRINILQLYYSDFEFAWNKWRN